MNSVILDERVKERVIADIDKYLRPGSFEKYRRRGMAWRLGFLFTGPPGTGKTSFITALATLFGVPIYTITLSDMSDQQLSALLVDMNRRCILLIEDIDAAGLQQIQKSTDGDGAKPSFSGLLNAIDGVDSHEGHILIMTTNNAELLDEALIRPGRVDEIIDFPNANNTQAAALFKLFFGSEVTEGDSKVFGKTIPDGLFSHAAIQNFLRKYCDDPKKAVEEAPEWFKDAEAAARKAEDASLLSPRSWIWPFSMLLA